MTASPYYLTAEPVGVCSCHACTCPGCSECGGDDDDHGR